MSYNPFLIITDFSMFLQQEEKEGEGRWEEVMLGLFVLVVVFELGERGRVGEEEKEEEQEGKGVKFTEKALNRV